MHARAHLFVKLKHAAAAVLGLQLRQLGLCGSRVHAAAAAAPAAGAAAAFAAFFLWRLGACAAAGGRRGRVRCITAARRCVVVMLPRLPPRAWVRRIRCCIAGGAGARRTWRPGRGRSCCCCCCCCHLAQRTGAAPYSAVIVGMVPLSMAVLCARSALDSGCRRVRAQRLHCTCGAAAAHRALPRCLAPRQQGRSALTLARQAHDYVPCHLHAAWARLLQLGAGADLARARSSSTSTYKQVQTFGCIVFITRSSHLHTQRSQPRKLVSLAHPAVWLRPQRAWPNKSKLSTSPTTS